MKIKKDGDGLQRFSRELRELREFRESEMLERTFS